MPVAVPELPACVDPPRKLWTRAEFEALSSSGVLDQQKLELVEGELINKMGKKRPHSNAVEFLHVWLLSAFGAFLVNQEVSIDVAPEDNPINEPEPDLIVLKRRYKEYIDNPVPGDLQLAIEVGDTTLAFDLTTKAALYARAGIAEYWVYDVGGQRMIVHRDPKGGRYRSIVAYGPDETVTPLAAPEASLRVGDIAL